MSKSGQPKLTSRERQVLKAMAGGLARKEIADSLGINFHTVDYFIRRIYSKLQVNSSTAAVSAAIQNGLLVDSDPDDGGHTASMEDV